MRENPRERDAILARFAQLSAFPLELYPIDPAAMVEAARLLQLNPYDASYLLLARATRSELVTLDPGLTRAI